MNPLHRAIVGLPGGCRDRAQRHRRCRKKDQVLCPDRRRAVLRRAATPAFGPAEDNDCDLWDRAAARYGNKKRQARPSRVRGESGCPSISAIHVPRWCSTWNS